MPRGKRTPEASLRYNKKLPMANTDAETRTFYQPASEPYPQFYKDAASYRLRDKPPAPEDFPMGKSRQKRGPAKKGYKDLK